MKILVLYPILIISFVVPAQGQKTATDSISITFEVVVPESTPDDATIFWAGSLNNWDPGSKGWGFGPKDFSRPAKYNKGKWTIELTAPKDSEEFYKYTRGSVYSTEERPDFTYRPVRKIVFDESKTVRDTVEAWHDIPPKALSDAWPAIKLHKADLNISSNGIPMDGSGTIIYDKQMGSRFYDFHDTRVKGTPGELSDPVFYYVPISDAPDNTVLLAAGKTKPESAWQIYIDKNNDNRISSGEKIFSTQASKKWTGNVKFQDLKEKEIVSDTVEIIIKLANNLPAEYRSSVKPEAPSLTFKLPFKQRTGEINQQPLNLFTFLNSSFIQHHKLVIDRNQNDTLEIGSGSNEIYAPDMSKMNRQQKFYLHPTFKLGDQFWQVANVHPHGDWIQLRPVPKSDIKQQIAEGKPSPEWQAITVSGDTLSSKSLHGKYILLDFWGSWCGPCIEEIPLLRKVYQKYKNRNFEMVGFAYESKASLNKAMKEYRLPWPQILDDKATFSSKFLVRGYPTHYLIGPDGNILETGSDLRGEKLTQTLEKHLE